jgi:hypothetical protein
MIELLLFLILCVLLFGASAVLAGFGWLAVIVLIFASLYLLIVATASIFVGAARVAPKVPGAVAAFLKGYAKILAAPIVGPVFYWRSVCERRARGEYVGAVSISLTFLWTFIFGIALSWFAFLIPLLILISAYHQAMQS